ncbi:MAG TPA: polyprenyl synthetase family protein, partial [Anaerolineales bacterium]
LVEAKSDRMSLQYKTEQMLPALEQELKRQVQRLDRPDTAPFHNMLSYHMGWTGDGAGPKATGKRVRPLLMLLVVDACNGEWLHSLPPAAAIELIHNFSLVHDDVEDNSSTRRGRPTVWNKFGVAMAVNVGDALFALSNLAVLDAAAHHPEAAVVRAAGVLHAACLALTQGQFLDMSYEKRSDISLDAYWPMVNGKTAALLGASTEMGAIFGGCDASRVQHFADFGRQLGQAFQVQDDMLGIWGDEKATGKSAASDLVEGKNSLPVLFGIAQHRRFAERWARSAVTAEETALLAQLLKDEGAFEYCRQEAQRLTDLAMKSLEAAQPHGPSGEALFELAGVLLGRHA